MKIKFGHNFVNKAYFFGYGSLVNRETHAYPDPQPARLRGWRRVWRQTRLREVAFLSVEPDPESVIDGLIARVPNHDWAALDEREWAYERLPASDDVEHGLIDPVEISVYCVPDASRVEASHPIYLSYLDAVVQGFLREFGVDGAARFFVTTTGWSAPILNDRTRPRYPRAQTLEARETAFVDAQLAGLSAVVKDLDEPGTL